MASIPTPGELAELSVEARLQLLDAIWASLGDEAEKLPVPEWHLVEIRRRLAAFAADGNAGRPVDEFLAELKRRL